MTTPIRNISIIGAGAMGSFYASKFYDAAPECISFGAVGERHERLKAGIHVNGKPYPVPVIGPGDDAPPADFIIVAVKHHHLPQAIKDMAHRVGPDTLILSIMNGIDSEEMLIEAYGEEKVFWAIAVGIDATKENGSVTCTSPGKIIFGDARNTENLSERVLRVQALFDEVGIAHETREDQVRTVWWKFMVNVGLNPVSAILKVPYSVFQNSKECQELMESGMREVVALAEAEGIDLTVKDIEEWYPFMANMGPEGKTSMLQDVDAKRKTEVEMLAGKVIELGEKHGIPTPVNRAFLRMIQVIEQGY